MPMPMPMAVSSSSQCYQAVRRHLRPHCDSIWVPESLLASAFERYVATFRIGARYGSSVPGPIEHRKRLAKRHMGELQLGQSHSSAPIWNLANLVDLTQWQWKPPTSPDRINRPEKCTTTNEMHPLSDSFFPPRGDPAYELRKRDEVLLPQDVTLRGVAEPLPSTASDMASAPVDVIHAALESLSRDMENNTGTPSLFSRFCDGWQQALAGGLFQAEAIDRVLAGIGDGLNVQPIHTHDPRIADRLKLLLIEATIEGISKERSDHATFFDHVAWDSVLHGVSTIRLNTIRIFAKAIACIPEQSLKEVSLGILRNLDAFFNAMGRVTEHKTLVRQAAKMAVPLRSLGRPELRFILDDATQKVLGYADVKGMSYKNVRLSWLLLVARIPGVDEEYLVRVCNTLDGGIVGRPLTESEVCQLFLVWANSRAPFERYARIRNVLNYRGTMCYRLLSARLWKTSQYYRIKQFAKLLHAIGRENDLLFLVKGVSHRCRRGPCSLANLALKMRRPRAAIDMLCLYEESQRRKSSFWESPFGFKSVEILTWVPKFDHNKLWRTLRILPTRQLNVRYRRGKLKWLDPNETTKIAAAGIVLGLSPYLSKRKSFALMTTCYLNLQRHNAKLPLSFLRALIHNVTRPLAAGQPGITYRLRYALYIIQQQVGRAQARQAAAAMERQRKHNFAPK